MRIVALRRAEPSAARDERPIPAPRFGTRSGPQLGRLIDREVSAGGAVAYHEIVSLAADSLVRRELASPPRVGDED